MNYPEQYPLCLYSRGRRIPSRKARRVVEPQCGIRRALQTCVRAARRCDVTITRCCLGPEVCNVTHRWPIRVKGNGASGLAGTLFLYPSRDGAEQESENPVAPPKRGIKGSGERSRENFFVWLNSAFSWQV